jgi:hypothetical protein|tara:strand:+ start:87 stop:380 length:294 start_codon:yes stop_codon:yes gene_type:complete
MTYHALDEELASIELSPGDVLIESSTGCVGFLLKRERRIDMVHDDMYFWEVRWADESLVPEFKTFSQFRILEEDYLKISIILDIIKWQSINGGTFEL